MKRFLLTLLLPLALLAQSPKLGHIDFPASASGPVQAHFIQGVLLLHSFEYDDAREEFQAASKLDPHFAMAYWGEALTHTHPLWGQQDVSAARAALNRLAPNPQGRLALAPTDREKGYLSAVEALYGDGDKTTRDSRYADAMVELKKKYPEDLEAAAFYALALLGTCEHGREFPVYMRAAAVAEEVYAKNPQHPGALHYLIHSYDDPVHAPLGLRAARVYGDVAGAASHARHMPSHIFFSLGMWDDAIAANEASVAVADERVKRKGLGPEKRNYHSLLWLEYSYLQEGRNADARRLLAEIDSSGAAKTSLNWMRATYAVETAEWDKPISDEDLAHADTPLAVAILTAQGHIAVHNGKLDHARELAEAAQLSLTSHSHTPASEGHHSAASSEGPQKAAEIMAQQLAAAILFADGKREEAFRLLEKTTGEEDSLGMEIGLEIGPPLPLKPAHELYGEMLLASGRPKEALAQFQRALARAPGRALSLRGLSKAATESGDPAVANRAVEDLRLYWRSNSAGSF